MNLTDFKVLTFDCYGTLIDWESGMFQALQPLVAKAARPLSRDQVLEAHARHESYQQLTTPTRVYRDILAIVYKRLAEEWGVPVSWDECVAYGESISEWPAFEDSAGGASVPQTALQAGHPVERRNVVLRPISSRTELRTFDAIFSAEDIGSYKPSPRNFDIHARMPA